MSVVKLLTPELLTQFRAAASAAGLPVVDDLRPGLSPAEQDALVKPLALEVPDELRSLWGWGIPSRDIELNGEELTPVRVLAPEFELLRPDEAVALTQSLNGMFDFAPGESAWVVIGRWCGPHGYLYVDCSNAHGPRPVGVRLEEDPDISTEFPSLGAYFDRCVRSLRNGEYGVRDGVFWADETLTQWPVWRAT